MTRKPGFWIAFTLVFVGSVTFFIKNYDKVFPVLSLDIRMSRDMALDAAAELSEKYNWKPIDYRTAVTFYSDRDLQTFVELEGGGLEKFKTLSKDSIYFPYGWKVRHFQEKDPNEILVWFTPSGMPYSFEQILSEDEPGPALDRKSAFSIAMGNIKKDWKIDISNFSIIDESEKVQPSGRVDHTFTYQRNNVEIGENGFLRLKLIVSGERLTGVIHYPHIPEAFQRRFEEMRSANNTIAFSATMGVVFLYGLGGIIIGIFFLLREGLVLWKGALLWGIFIASLQTLSEINYLPLMWMNYDTSIQLNSFIIQLVFSSLVNLLLFSIIYALSFIAAESLSRKAFPKRIQFWRVWDKKIGASIPILGRTIGGYYSAAIFLVYILIFYTYTHENLGWWSPADTDYDPNILAAYFPWLTSIAISLGAGFWEECLFRAVPLAGAALIGDRFGKRNLFIMIAMGVQSIIFGAGHANYPVQPAYARVIELILPSLFFGAIYLRFGLLAGIIMHYAIDVVLFSLPLFVAQVPGIWIHRFFVILFLMVPLLVVSYRRIESGKWFRIIGPILNQDWRAVENKTAITEDELQNINFTKKSKYLSKYLLTIFGVLGLFFWLSQITLKGDLPSMEISKSDAEKIAADVLASSGFLPDSDWTRHTIPLVTNDKKYQFIWQTAGPDIFTGMIGTYLREPVWQVRYRLYKGDVASRAEEYLCWINSRGESVRIIHTMAEAQRANSIDESEARAKALEFLENRYALNIENLVELEARSEKMPYRMDWTFQFQDTSIITLEKGELRNIIRISGDKITDFDRTVHVPEEWTRKENEKNAKNEPFNFLVLFVIIFSLLTAIFSGIIRWSKKKFQIDLFIKSLVILVVLSIIGTWNNWPSITWNFSTSEPLADQLFQALFSSGLSIVFLSLAQALLAGSTHSLMHSSMLIQKSSTPIKGVFIGLFISGSAKVFGIPFPDLEPLIGYWSTLSGRNVIIGTILQGISGYIQLTLIALVAITGISALTNNLTKNIPMGIACFFLLGIAMASGIDGSLELKSLWVVFGILFSAMFYIIYNDLIRFQPEILPIITAVMQILPIVANGLLDLYPGNFFGSILASISVGIFSYGWYLELSKPPAMKNE